MLCDFLLLFTNSWKDSYAMGGCFSQEPVVDFDGPVDFNHFQILRAIGKGAFGKVCIVKKRDTKQMYAMKYMNKVQIIKKRAVDNVFREMDILMILDHPFLVNLWFTFQDREDIFMVLDLMLGGDLSYHLEKEGRFMLPRVKLYMAELALGLDYLRGKKIIHRDVKPANMLLDSEGHIHLTDFNVACIVHRGVANTSITGTKPYMAPEVIRPMVYGYSYAVDWWSLGVSIYEMLRGQRPFHIERHMSNDDMYNNLRHTRPSASTRWDEHTCDILKMLLHPDADKRLRTMSAMMSHPFFEDTDWEEVESKKAAPSFIPAQNRINCDPTHELEEMIVEPNPLHKKQHRLSKRHFKPEDEAISDELEKMDERFKRYNRMRMRSETGQMKLSPKDDEQKTIGSQGSQQAKDSQGSQQAKESQGSQQAKESQGSQQGKDSQGSQQAKESQGSQQGKESGQAKQVKQSQGSDQPQGSRQAEVVHDVAEDKSDEKKTIVELEENHQSLPNCINSFPHEPNYRQTESVGTDSSQKELLQ